MIYQDWDLELTGTNICIDAMKEEDGEAYGRLLLGDLYDTLQKLTGEKQLPTGFRDILDHASNDETHAIRLLPDRQLIGWITLQKNKAGEPDIGISLTENQCNKGYGPEAIQLFGNYLHETYNLSQLKARISSKNQQSRNAFAKVGAVLDQEVPDERLTHILEEHPDHKTAEGFTMTICCYHIPLPIKEILPGSHPDKDTIREAQEAYERQETQWIKEIQLTELELIQKRLESNKDASPNEFRSYLKKRIEELE